MVRLFTVVFFLLFTSVSISYAHPGNTAADGCHYCRTNCAKWGEVEGERHCHGGSKPSTAAPAQVAPQTKPTAVPNRITPRPTQRPQTSSVPKVICSATSDNVCSRSCSAGNDYDCCNKQAGYTWYHDWGCYPVETGRCSATQDNKCSSMCTAGNDYDCCQRLEGYTWYDNWGCYPKS